MAGRAWDSENLPAARRAVTDVHLVLDDGRRAVADGVNDAAPVRVAAEPACFYEGAVRDRACGGVGIGKFFAPSTRTVTKRGVTLIIADDFLSQFETDMIERGLKVASDG